MTERARVALVIGGALVLESSAAVVKSVVDNLEEDIQKYNKKLKCGVDSKPKIKYPWNDQTNARGEI